MRQFFLLLFISVSWFGCKTDDLASTEQTHKFKISGDSTFIGELNGVPYSVVLPNAYRYNGDSTYLMIICHGNGGPAVGLAPTFKEYALKNNIAYAIIRIQDQWVEPYTTEAAGWGNQITSDRTVNFYNELRDKFNFRKSVILCGVSMGGLTMGNLSYKKAFPILFCLGIGPVPSLKYIWEFGNTSRKPAIRAAYKMSLAGADDKRIDEFIAGYDWRTTESQLIGGLENKKFNHKLYIFAGSKDTQFKVEFGGAKAYTDLSDAINRAGGFCRYEQNDAETHAGVTLFDSAIPIISKEIGL